MKTSRRNRFINKWNKTMCGSVYYMLLLFGHFYGSIYLFFRLAFSRLLLLTRPSYDVRGIANFALKPSNFTFET